MHNTNSVVRRGKYGIRGDQTQNKLISEAIGDNQRKLTKQMITSFCHTPTHCARLIWGTYGMEGSPNDKRRNKTNKFSAHYMFSGSYQMREPQKKKTNTSL